MANYIYYSTKPDIGAIESGSATNPITYTYQWKRINPATQAVTNIAGATNSTYITQFTDLGFNIKATVTATTGTGSTSQDSNTVGQISSITKWINRVKHWRRGVGAVVAAAILTGSGAIIYNTVTPGSGGTGAPTHVDLTGSTLDLSTGSTRLLTATLKDVSGNTVSSDNSTVITFAKTAGTGTVTGLGTATASNGIATDIVTGSGTGAITLAGSATSIPAAATLAFNIVTGGVGTANIWVNTSAGTIPSRCSPACTYDSTKAYGSFSAAAAAASAGDAIVVKSGTYPQQSISTNLASTTTITCESTSCTTGKIVLLGSHFTVSNFIVNGGVVFGYPAHHDAIIQSNIDNPSGVGVTVDGNVLSQPVPGVHDILIDSNKIHDDCSSGTIVGCEADGINMNGWGSITITNNEMYGLIQEVSQAAHTDILQSYNANNGNSAGLVFSNNYMHDNNTEGFFIKDGPAANVTFDDNLCIRNPSSAHEMDAYDITNFEMKKNTCWLNTGAVLETTFNPGTMTFDHNVVDQINNLGTWSVTKSNNIYGAAPFTSPFSSLGTGESINASPGFNNTATDDYRLASQVGVIAPSNPAWIGVDWRPVDQVYGPR